MQSDADRPQITVILTAYNYGRFLEECLASLLAQTLLARQLIVVDDASTDETSSVLDEMGPRLAARMDLVRIDHAQRCGFAASLNEAMASATCEFAVHVDADDTCRPNFLARLARALQENPQAAYAYPKMELFGNETGIYQTYPFDASRLIFHGNYIPNIAMMRTSVFRCSSGYRDLATHVDWDLWLTFLELGAEGILVPEVLYDWRRHGLGMTLQSRSTRLAIRARLLAAHKRLVLRHIHEAPLWLARACLQRGIPRRFRRRGPTLSASGWIEAGTASRPPR